MKGKQDDIVLDRYYFHADGTIRNQPTKLSRSAAQLKIADWYNQATENEITWITYIWLWYDENILEEERLLGQRKVMFRDDCKSGEIFSTVTWEPRELSEDEKRERAEARKRYIDPFTGKPLPALGLTRRELKDLPPRTVGPELVNGVLIDDPPLSGRSRGKIIAILPLMVKLWEEYARENPKMLKPIIRLWLPAWLKKCPQCGTWFVIRVTKGHSKTDKRQKYCQTKSPRCRVVAFQTKEKEKPEYNEKARLKMKLWRAKKEEREAAARRNATLQ